MQYHSATFEQPTSSKKNSAILTLVGQNINRAVYIASSEPCESEAFVWRWNIFERKYTYI